MVCSVSVALSFTGMNGMRIYKESLCLRKVGSGKPVATEKDQTNIGWEENTLDRYQ